MKITNTVTGKQQIFKALQSSPITLYVCGITPYDAAHIGHGRCYVVFDLLYRLQKFLGYHTIYCRNFTDIDDKLLIRAEREFNDATQYRIIADRFIEQYNREMVALNCLPPDYEPRVTDHIPDIIDFISRLIERGYAYESAGDVYFMVSSFPAYGKLSKQHKEDLLLAHRVQLNDKKRDQLDFALWKSEESETFWKSPWGYGRPGWHIECSALAARYLGETIDIHGGGLDLIFPHHENEIAQSESLHGKELAHCWMHNGLLRINQEKMSKSLGNFLTLADLFAQADPMVVRYYLLSHHYRSPMDFSFEDMGGFEKSYQRLTRLFVSYSSAETELITQESIREHAVAARMFACLEDDLNTPAFFGIIFENVDEIKRDKNLGGLVYHLLYHVLGLTLQPLQEKRVDISDQVNLLIEERKKARMQKNWMRADEIREQLSGLGIQVKDEKN